MTVVTFAAYLSLMIGWWLTCDCFPKVLCADRQLAFSVAMAWLSCHPSPWIMRHSFRSVSVRFAVSNNHSQSSRPIWKHAHWFQRRNLDQGKAFWCVIDAKLKVRDSNFSKTPSFAANGLFPAKSIKRNNFRTVKHSTDYLYKPV